MRNDGNGAVKIMNERVVMGMGTSYPGDRSSK
jgi:hypothetical protein